MSFEALTQSGGTGWQFTVGSWTVGITDTCMTVLQMSKADKARTKKDKANSFNASGGKSVAKNSKRWN